MDGDLREALHEIRDRICELQKEVKDLRYLIGAEIYGQNGRLGLKQQIAILWEERDKGTRYKVAIVGALVSALISLGITVAKTLFR